jgi:YD repeat-containing protein
MAALKLVGRKIEMKSRTLLMTTSQGLSKRTVKLLHCCLASALCLLLSPASFSQNFDRGFVPYESYQTSGIDSVNLANGNLLVHIPIISYPQRGTMPPLSLSLRYNNPRWTVIHTNCYLYYGENVCHSYWQHDGSSITVVRDDAYAVLTYGYTDPNNGYATQAFDALDSSGAQHVLEPTGPLDPNNVWNVPRESIDATGLQLAAGPTAGPPSPDDLAHVPIIDPHGIRHFAPVIDPTIADPQSPVGFLIRQDENGFLETTQDPSGNVITPQITNTGGASYNMSGWIDTIGRSIPAPHLNANLSYCETLNFPAVNGGTAPLMFCYTYPSSFASPFTPVWAPAAFPPYASVWLTSITLPNGTGWVFTYNSFAELSSITLPTGGVISYTWANSATCNATLTNSAMPNNENWTSATPVFCDRVVTTRTFDAKDGSPSSTWSYSIGATQTLPVPNVPVTVTDPELNDTVHSFVFSYNGLGSPYEATTQYYIGSQASNKLVKRIDRQYQNLNNNCVAFDSIADGLVRGAAVVPLSTTTTWPNGQVSQTSFVYDSGATFKTSDEFGTITYTCPLVYGHVVQQSDYDYGSTAAGPLLRQTVTQYQWQGNSNYQAANLLATPCVVTTYGAGSVPQPSGCTPPAVQANQVAQTIFGYDENNGSPQGVLGNQTSVTRWLNGGPPPKSQTVYNTQGMPSQKIDPNGNPTTMTYDSTGLFPSQIQYPDTAGIHHIEKFAYDANVGQATSHTDQNGQITTTQYDTMGRVTQVNYPTQLVNGVAMASTMTYVYTDTPGSVSVQQNLQQDGSTTLTNLQYIDGLGRVSGTRQVDPEGDVLVANTYDLLGRVSTVTNPYRTLQDPTYGLTTTKYDVLGRVTEVDHPDGSSLLTSYTGRATQVQDESNGTARVTRISQSDALGRLVSVCEVTNVVQAGGNSPSACGQDIVSTGFLTTYQYDALSNLTGVTQGGVTRSFGYDSLTRLQAAYNPESGTTSYTYDANGNVVTRTRAAPNQANPNLTVTTNYQYDALDRLTQQSFSDGVTPTVTKKYDSSLELGQGLDNTIGRLSAEYVTDASGKLVSGRVYGYDPMGRVVDNSQCTLQNCASATTYPVTYGYDLLGKTLSATTGQGTTLSYSYNSAGRLLTVSSSVSDANHPGTLFSSAHYNALGALKTVTLGNGLYESYGYDTRGRLTSYSSSFTPPSAEVSFPRLRGSRWMTARLAKSETGLQGPFVKHLGLRDFVTVRAKGSILISGFSPRRKGDRGVVTVTITSLGLVPRSGTFALPYGAGASAVDIARQLAGLLEGDASFPLKATVRQLGSAAVIELVGSEAANIASFEVQASVASKRSIPAFTVTASGVMRKVPLLLSDLRTRHQVAQ